MACVKGDGGFDGFGGNGRGRVMVRSVTLLMVLSVAKLWRRVDRFGGIGVDVIVDVSVGDGVCGLLQHFGGGSVV